MLGSSLGWSSPTLCVRTFGDSCKARWAHRASTGHPRASGPSQSDPRPHGRSGRRWPRRRCRSARNARCPGAGTTTSGPLLGPRRTSTASWARTGPRTVRRAPRRDRPDDPRCGASGRSQLLTSTARTRRPSAAGTGRPASTWRSRDAFTLPLECVVHRAVSAPVLSYQRQVDRRTGAVTGPSAHSNASARSNSSSPLPYPRAGERRGMARSSALPSRRPGFAVKGQHSPTADGKDHRRAGTFSETMPTYNVPGNTRSATIRRSRCAVYALSNRPHGEIHLSSLLSSPSAIPLLSS